MKWFKAPGVRARLIGALLAGAVVSGVAIILVFKPLVLSNIALYGGQRLMLAVRTAALTAPTDPAGWGAWVEALDRSVTHADVFIIWSHPGDAGFSKDCARYGVSGDDALAAYAEGECLSFPDPDVRVSDSGRDHYQALVRLSGPKAQRAILGFKDTGTGGVPEIAKIWALLLLFLGMIFAIAIAGGYLAGYFLLIRPIAAMASTAERADGSPVTGRSSDDVSIIREHLESLSRQALESSRRAARLSVELKHIRADLKGAQSSLLRAEKLASVGQLAAGIAHEIGNPIGIILGLSELLEKGDATDDEAHRFAKEVHSSARRVDGIIRDLLTFARPSRHEQASSDVRDVVESTLKLLRPHKRFRDVEVDTRLEEGTLMAEIRSSQLQQVLINLLLNASDATDGKGRVVISVVVDDRYVVIQVSDDGPGIGKDEREHIFDPFYSTKAVKEGTGLGLAICAQIVGVYGGDISIEDAPDGGALFSIRLWRSDI